MDENPTLSEAVFDAVSEWLGDSGLATGFLLVVPTLDPDGLNSIRTVTPPEQPFYTSLGLVAFADEYIRDDVRTAFLAPYTDPE